MKTISIFLALINSLIAGLILAASLSTTAIHQTALWWSFTKIAAAASVILVAVITWHRSAHTANAGLIHRTPTTPAWSLRDGARESTRDYPGTARQGKCSATLVSLCSLFLVALGAATLVWTFHLALVSGDIEFHMIIYGGSLIVQGMTSLFEFAGESRNTTSL